MPSVLSLTGLEPLGLPAGSGSTEYVDLKDAVNIAGGRIGKEGRKVQVRLGGTERW